METYNTPIHEDSPRNNVDLETKLGLIMNDGLPQNVLSMEKKWKNSNSNDTSIWIPDSGLTHIQLIRRWNKLSRLQRSFIYAAVAVSFLLIGVFSIDRVYKTKSNKNNSIDDGHHKIINETLVTFSSIMDIKIKPPVEFKEPKLLVFTGPTNSRQEAVVNSFKHAWNNYKLYAWGKDNLQPLTLSGSNWFGLGLTLIDALDTAFIMGLKDEFKEGRQWVESDLVFTNNKDVNLFEVTIRVLGALLTNYHLSGDEMFLDKARDLGDRLMGAFSSPSGIPFSDVNLYNQKAHVPEWGPYSSTAEVTTIQLEFRELSRATGDPKYEDAAASVSEKIHQMPKKHGLVPIFINTKSGVFMPHATITLGARGDSYYEYLLKQWIQTGKTINYLKDDYLTGIEGVREFLAKRTSANNLLFIGELAGSETFSPKMDHLVCFLPGTLALGYLHGLPDWHMQMAQDLIYTCYMTYAAHPTFLAPEITHFHVANNELDMYTKMTDSHSLLRPEFVESLWYMYQITGNTTYQEWGWNVYQALEKYARTDTGYCSLNNVNTEQPDKRDFMESFFLSETLKYLYMLFSSDRYMIDLTNFVVNTEAHPLPVHTN